MLSQQGSHTRKLQEALRGLVSGGEAEAWEDSTPDGGGGGSSVDAKLAKRPSAVRSALSAMLERVSHSERRTHSLERQRTQDQVRGIDHSVVAPDSHTTPHTHSPAGNDPPAAEARAGDGAPAPREGPAAALGQRRGVYCGGRAREGGA